MPHADTPRRLVREMLVLINREDVFVPCVAIKGPVQKACLPTRKRTHDAANRDTEEDTVTAQVYPQAEKCKLWGLLVPTGTLASAFSQLSASSLQSRVCRLPSSGPLWRAAWDFQNWQCVLVSIRWLYPKIYSVGPLYPGKHSTIMQEGKKREKNKHDHEPVSEI